MSNEITPEHRQLLRKIGGITGPLWMEYAAALGFNPFALQLLADSYLTVLERMTKLGFDPAKGYQVMVPTRPRPDCRNIIITVREAAAEESALGDPTEEGDAG